MSSTNRLPSADRSSLVSRKFPNYRWLSRDKAVPITCALYIRKIMWQMKALCRKCHYVGPMKVGLGGFDPRDLQGAGERPFTGSPLWCRKKSNFAPQNGVPFGNKASRIPFTRTGWVGQGGNQSLVCAASRLHNYLKVFV